jgi:hypothetical protein
MKKKFNKRKEKTFTEGKKNKIGNILKGKKISYLCIGRCSAMRY